MKTPPTERIGYRPDEAADVLGVGRTAMYELLKCGEVESVKVGRSRIVPADALRAFLDRKRKGAAA